MELEDKPYFVAVVKEKPRKYCIYLNENKVKLSLKGLRELFNIDLIKHKYLKKEPSYTLITYATPKNKSNVVDHFAMFDYILTKEQRSKLFTALSN